jgi:hypothetical protein
LADLHPRWWHLRILGPRLRFVVCVAVLAWVTVFSILPAGRAENILRGASAFDPSQAFAASLLFWIFGSLWILQATDAARVDNAERGEGVRAGVVVGLDAVILVGTLCWWILFALGGPSR